MKTLEKNWKKRLLSILVMVCMVIVLMPDLPAYAADSYILTIVNGTKQGTSESVLTVEAGTGLSVTVNPLTGKVFDVWNSSDGVSITSANSETSWIIMPANDATITATYKNTPEIDTELKEISAKISDPGWISAVFTPTYNRENRNYTINCTATSSSIYFYFLNMVEEQTIAATADDVNYPNPTTVPYPLTKDVTRFVFTVTAKDGTTSDKYTVTLNRGSTPIYPVTVEGGNTATTTPVEGDTVNISAGGTPDGKVFDKWTTADGVVFANADSSNTSFIMLNKAVTVTATYKDATEYKAVTSISSVPTSGEAGTAISLAPATVNPADATNKTIVWSVKDVGTTGVTNADLISGTFTPATAGTLVLTATIVNGLTASTPYTQDFTITVSPPSLEATPPVITLLGSASVNVANGATYTDAGATASDNVDGNITGNIVTTISNNVDSGTTFDNTKTAIYTYHYNVQDVAGNHATEVTRTVIVAAALPPSDTTPPVITLLGSASVNVANGATYTDAGATASDNIDGNITGNIVTTISNNVDSGTTFDNTKTATYTYHYNVTDAAGNLATAVTREVIVAAPVVDTTLPVITLLGSASVNVANGATYTDAGATALDNKDGNITTNIVTTISNDVDGETTFDNTKAATYTYHYNVTDAAGNLATAVTREVIVAAPVADTNRPVITLLGDLKVNLANGAAYTDAGATALDITGADLTTSMVTTISNNVDSGTTFDSKKAATYTYHYNVTDAEGVEATEVTRIVIVAAATQGGNIPVATTPVVTAPIAPAPIAPVTGDGATVYALLLGILALLGMVIVGKKEYNK